MQFLFLLIKNAFFALVILILGQVLSWDNRSLSEHVKHHLNQVEWKVLFHRYQAWFYSLIQDTQQGKHKRPATSSDAKEWISQEEKQKLRHLIQTPPDE